MQTFHDILNASFIFTNTASPTTLNSPFGILIKWYFDVKASNFPCILPTEQITNSHWAMSYLERHAQRATYLWKIMPQQFLYEAQGLNDIHITNAKQNPSLKSNLAYRGLSGMVRGGYLQSPSDFGLPVQINTNIFSNAVPSTTILYHYATGGHLEGAADTQIAMNMYYTKIKQPGNTEAIINYSPKSIYNESFETILEEGTNQQLVNLSSSSIINNTKLDYYRGIISMKEFNELSKIHQRYNHMYPNDNLFFKSIDEPGKYFTKELNFLYQFSNNITHAAELNYEEEWSMGKGFCFSRAQDISHFMTDGEFYKASLLNMVNKQPEDVRIFFIDYYKAKLKFNIAASHEFVYLNQLDVSGFLPSQMNELIPSKRDRDLVARLYASRGIDPNLGYAVVLNNSQIFENKTKLIEILDNTQRIHNDNLRGGALATNFHIDSAMYLDRLLYDISKTELILREAGYNKREINLIFQIDFLANNLKIIHEMNLPEEKKEDLILHLRQSLGIFSPDGQQMGKKTHEFLTRFVSDESERLNFASPQAIDESVKKLNECIKQRLQEKGINYTCSIIDIEHLEDMTQKLRVCEDMVEQPAPIIEDMVEQPAPIIENMVEQPAPIIENSNYPRQHYYQNYKFNLYMDTMNKAPFSYVNKAVLTVTPDRYKIYYQVATYITFMKTYNLMCSAVCSYFPTYTLF